MMIVALAMIAQFKEGDMVYIKNDSARGWLTQKMAFVRYEPVEQSSVAASDVFNANLNAGGQSLIARWPKNSKAKVINVYRAEGETIIKLEHAGHRDVYWFHDDDVAALTPEIEKKIQDDATNAKNAEIANAKREKLMRYARNRTDAEAVNAALALGLDPITMSAKEAAALSAAHRRALSSLKQRWKVGR